MRNHFLRPAMLAGFAVVTALSSPAHADAAADADANASANVAKRYAPRPYSTVINAEWSRNAAIYQINTRQFTREGTLRAAEKQLPRLKELGVGIVWLMPIHPIGQVKRKGELGSPYAVQDFFKVSPELGSLDDMKSFVASAHKLGLRVILDWVGNHTAWDNVIRRDHPDWYLADRKGQPRPTPWFDWDDIIELDYGKPAVREYMTRALRYWVKEVGVDGYRADAAGFVPQDFWDNAAAELRAIKPVFLLAEWESRDMHARAFDATYSWTWYDSMKAIAGGHADATSLNPWYAWNEKFYPKNAYRMLYVTNHDKNSWEGTEFEIFGDALDATIALSVISEGIPLMYNGQEAGNQRRLKFFERDPIEWKPSPYAKLYRDLFALKKENTALWNGQWGADMEPVLSDAPKQVLSFVRQNARDKVFAVFNLSAKPATVRFDGDLHLGRYRDWNLGQPAEFKAGSSLTLAPWSYKLYVR